MKNNDNNIDPVYIEIVNTNNIKSIISLIIS